MLLVSTAEHFADPLGKLVSSEQPLGLGDLAFAMDPFRLDGIQPRTLGGQKAGHYPYSTTAGFYSAVMGSDPVAHFIALMPAGVVPDKEQSLLAGRGELVGAVVEKLRGYGAYRAAIYEPDPATGQLGDVQPVAGQCLRLGIIVGRDLLDEAHRLLLLCPRTRTGANRSKFLATGFLVRPIPKTVESSATETAVSPA